MVLAYLVLDQDQYTEYDAHYLPNQETNIARLSEPKNYRDGIDPEGLTVLCAEIPCWCDDDVWNSSDQKIGDLVMADLVKLTPSARYVETQTRRLPSVYPVFESATMEERRRDLNGAKHSGISFHLVDKDFSCQIIFTTHLVWAGT